MATLDSFKDGLIGDSVYDLALARRASLLSELRRDPRVVKETPKVRRALERRLDRLDNDLKQLREQLGQPTETRAEGHLRELIARLDRACVRAKDDTHDATVRLYASEVVKLMDILVRERDWTRVGVWALRLELCFVAVFVLVVATVAASQAPG
jgi:ElaB/YqjD/DUF883 family membrane-anchored ribosome-binding protein